MASGSDSSSWPEPLRQALAELADEQWREAVEEEKAKLRARMRRPWYQRLFPYRIKIERID